MCITNERPTTSKRRIGWKCYHLRNVYKDSAEKGEFYGEYNSLAYNIGERYEARILAHSKCHLMRSKHVGFHIFTKKPEPRKFLVVVKVSYSNPILEGLDVATGLPCVVAKSIKLLEVCRP